MNIAAEFAAARLAAHAQGGSPSAMRNLLAREVAEHRDIVALRKACVSPTWTDWLQLWELLDEKSQACTKMGFLAAVARSNGLERFNSFETTLEPGDSMAWLGAGFASCESSSSLWHSIAAWANVDPQAIRWHHGTRFHAAERNGEIWVSLAAGWSEREAYLAAHEFGHAAVWLRTQHRFDRVTDEALAEAIAGLACGNDSHLRWFEHGRVANALAMAEATRTPLVMEHVPWRLWHEPGYAQCYRAASALAAGLAATLRNKSLDAVIAESSDWERERW